MNLTHHILTDYFEEKKWPCRTSLMGKRREYASVRLYYPGCELSPEHLYVAGSDQQLPADGEVDLCLLTPRGDAAPRWVRYAVEVDCPLPAFFSQLQELAEVLHRWDDTLSHLLINGGSFQEILDASVHLLRGPCFFLDNQFRVLAQWGRELLDSSVSPYFAETLDTGRSPARFFEDLMSMPSDQRAAYHPNKNAVTSVHSFSQKGELLANCVIDGAPVLRFGMLRVRDDSGNGVRDVIRNLMRRLQESPGLRDLAASVIDSSDSLFSQLIDEPQHQRFHEISASLGLQNDRCFALGAIRFGAHIAGEGTLRTQLQLLHPSIHFFTYHKTLFALFGTDKCDGTEEEELDRRVDRFAETLRRLGAVCCVSNHFSTLRGLRFAHDQVRFLIQMENANSARVSGGDELPGHVCRYQDGMLFHILSDFFERHPFRFYCRQSFERMTKNEGEGDVSAARLLYTYLIHESNATTTARELHMHRNGVIYRVNRIEERYGYDLTDPVQRTLLLLLCMAHEAGYKG